MTFDVATVRPPAATTSGGTGTPGTGPVATAGSGWRPFGGGAEDRVFDPIAGTVSVAGLQPRTGRLTVWTDEFNGSQLLTQPAILESDTLGLLASCYVNTLSSYVWAQGETAQDGTTPPRVLLRARDDDTWFATAASVQALTTTVARLAAKIGP